MKNKGIRVGRFFGIELRLDYSWFILFFLIAWSFTLGIIPVVYGSLNTAEAIIVGLLSTVLLFVSVVIHEYAHSIYARKTGLKIDRITLFVFGGAAELEDEPRTAGQEFKMAGLGPLTSLGLSILFGFLMFIGINIGSDVVTATGGLLASANLLLALFNLIPGFPLDGGRMFRAIVWKITGNMLKATKIAATTGKLFAVLLMAYGFIQLVKEGAFGGIWLMLIGFFLYRTASASYEQTLTLTLLKDVSVSDVMTRNKLNVPGKTRVKNFLKNYVLKRKQAAVPDKASNEYFLHPDDPAVEAISVIASSGHTKVPVIKDGEIVGTISVDNLQTYILNKQKLESLAG